jgi:hypothetical protein
VKLFVDEDTGPNLAKALRTAGFRDIEWVGPRQRIEKSAKDPEWMPTILSDNFMVLSRNYTMLEVEEERRLIIEHRGRFVYLPQQATTLDLLRLVMLRWDWLKLEYDHQSRPFAWRLSAKNRTSRLVIEPVE